MAYTKQTWANSPSTTTPISAARLDYIEQGVKDAHDGMQPLDADLTAIAALSPANDDIVQRKSGVWTNRTMAQLAVDLKSTTRAYTYAIIFGG